MGYTSVAEVTANDYDDEIAIIIYLFQTVQTASEAFSLWEYSSRALKLTTHLHFVLRLRIKGAIHHSPLHIRVVHIYIYCVIIIIIITSTDKNLNVFSGSLSLFASTDSRILKIMAIFALKLFSTLICTLRMTEGTKLKQFLPLMSFIWALNPVHLP